METRSHFPNFATAESLKQRYENHKSSSSILGPTPHPRLGLFSMHCIVSVYFHRLLKRCVGLVYTGSHVSTPTGDSMATA